MPIMASKNDRLIRKEILIFQLTNLFCQAKRFLNEWIIVLIRFAVFDVNSRLFFQWQGLAIQLWSTTFQPSSIGTNPNDDLLGNRTRIIWEWIRLWKRQWKSSWSCPTPYWMSDSFCRTETSEQGIIKSSVVNLLSKYKKLTLQANVTVFIQMNVKMSTSNFLDTTTAQILYCRWPFGMYRRFGRALRAYSRHLRWKIK